MSIEQSFYSFTSSLTAPIYPILIPEGAATPAYTYQLSGSRPGYSADGPSNYPVTIQLDCWALTYSAVKNLQSSARTLLDGYTGAMGDHMVHLVVIEGEVDGFEPDTRLYRVTMFLNIFFRSV